MTEYITTKEAAKISGYSITHLAYLLRTKRIQGQRWYRSWMVSKRSLIEYLEQAGREINGRYGSSKPVSF